MELLFDDHWIDRKENVTRVLAEPHREVEPVLQPEYPWEESGIRAGQTLFWDEELEKFRIWYRAACPHSGKSGDPDDNREVSEREDKHAASFLCYAESKDGVSWTRPILGRYPFRGNTDNNILFPISSGSTVYGNIVKDPCDPARRYKALELGENRGSARSSVSGAGAGVCVNYSSDGLAWPEKPKLLISSDDMTDNNNLLPERHPVTKRWVCFMRPRTRPKKRFIGLAESEDFERWSYPRMTLTPDSLDDEFTEFYGLTTRHLADGFFVGLLWVFRNHPAASPVTTELVYSRDGYNYHRAMARKNFLGVGEPDDFDSRMTLPVAILERQAETLIFYNGSNAYHGSDRGQAMAGGVTKDGTRGRPCLGLARLPRGHFCGLRSSGEGVVETKYLCNYGAGGIRASAEIEAGGSLRADLLDHYGRSIPDYRAGICRMRKEADGTISFSWGSRNLRGIAGDDADEKKQVGHVVKVRFYLDKATLYGFGVGKPGTF